MGQGFSFLAFPVFCGSQELGGGSLVCFPQIKKKNKTKLPRETETPNVREISEHRWKKTSQKSNGLRVQFCVFCGLCPQAALFLHSLCRSSFAFTLFLRLRLHVSISQLAPWLTFQPHLPTPPLSPSLYTPSLCMLGCYAQSQGDWVTLGQLLDLSKLPIPMSKLKSIKVSFSWVELP